MSVSGREAEITLLHTARVQGHVLPVRDREWLLHSGGLLRCATVIQQVRAERRNVLLADCGVLLSGSPESYLSRGLLPIKAASFLRYDVRLHSAADALLERGTPGRYPFWDLVPAVCLSCGDAHPEAGRAKPYALCRRDGVCLAFVGLTGGACAPRHTGSAMAALQRLMPDLRRERPDLWVLLADVVPGEGGDDDPGDLHRILRGFPEFDLVLGPRLPWAAGGRVPGDTPWVGAAPDGRTIGRVDLTFDTVQRRIVRLQAAQIPVGPGIPEDPDLSAALGPSLGRMDVTLGQEIGTGVRRLGSSGPWAGQTGIQELLSRAAAHDAGADLVLLNSRGGGGLDKGPILYRDILRAVPEVPRLALLALTPEEIRSVLEENLGHMDSDRFLGIFGATYRYDPATIPGERILDLRLDDGSRPHGRRRFTVALDARDLEPGTPGRAVLRAMGEAALSRRRWVAFDARAAAIAVIREKGLEDVKPVRRSRPLNRVQEED